MRYVVARIETENREWAYRFYIANTMMYVNQALVGYVGKGKYYDASIADILNPRVEPKDDRTVDEIVSDVWAGITGKKKR